MILKLRKTNEKDIKKVLEIYEDGKVSLKRDGVNQWQTEGPSFESLKKDMENGVSYVLEEDGKILGTTANIPGEDPTYLEIDGDWLNDDDYLTIHRIAVSEKEKRRGLGQVLFKETEKLTKNLGLKNIRVDTHEDNFRMNHLLEKMGYEYCGIIRLPNGDLRKAFQKKLK